MHSSHSVRGSYDKPKCSASPPPGHSVEERLSLRQQAEERFAGLPASPSAVQQTQMPLAMQHLLHELQVHQIELEMQNDELRRAQNALDTAQARYFDVYEQAAVGYCTISGQGLITQANLTTASLVGVLRNRLMHRLLSEFIAREDRDIFYFFRQRLQDTQQPQSCELRLRKANKPAAWVRLEAMAVPGEEGDMALRMVITDITERKHADERLQLTALVFSHAQEGIAITDAQGCISEVNDAFTRITGYSRAEVLGQNPRLLKSGRQSPAFYVDLWQQLTSQGQWCGEIWNRRKNGQVYAEQLSINAVRGPNGAVQRYVALFSDITSLKLHEQQMEHLAHFDVLTGLPNRLLKADRLQQAMAHARRTGRGLAVAYIDLDGFKTINDQFGHEAGDQMLVNIARQMQQVLREGDTLARLGGDEFVAILIDMDDISACAPLLERLLAAAAQPLTFADQKLQVSASLGVTFYPQQQDVEADQLLRQADQAMYLAKQAGKNCYQVFDAAQDSHLRGWHADLRRLQQALAKQEFVLHYQPKVNMRTGQLVGAEALIRWQHPDKGLLPPTAFLPVFEGDPLAVDIGEWVIDSALAQMERWQAQGRTVPVSVNVGARQLQQADFVARLQALLAQHPQIKPQQLTIEILETSALQDIAYVSQVIDDCREIGVHFSLDDFGTGYSSLLYLKRLRVAELKIDQGFVRDMLDDPDDRPILEGIIGLARAFKREVIAEGVETVAHGTLLLQLGCELAQGYGIARPMPAADLLAWANSWQPDAAWRGL